MNVPYSWLKELVPDLPDLDALAELLPGLGLGLENVHELSAPPLGVVVARIVAADPLAGSDHLLVCAVDDGSGGGTGERRVVTGAPNARAGLLTAYAPPGVTLPAGVTVTARDVLGVASDGVLCSPKELGLYDYAGGLVAFGPDAEPGQEVRELWPGETVLELELTPNRADAFSILGVARDVAAKLGVAYRHPAAGLALGDPALDDGLSVTVEDEAACPRFTLQRIDNVRIGPSPLWLQRRLAALGLRPRNSVVDVTNYVTFELGQPSHAFDREKLTDGTLVVRRAQPGEPFVGLNGEELTLDAADLVIATPVIATPSAAGSRPVGLAGVIGGLDGSVRPETTSVALEVAHFDPATIRKAAKRHGLATDAHHRFERGVDPNLPPLASARCAQLIARVAGGTVHPGRSDAGGDAAERTVPFRPERVGVLMGFEVPPDVQRAYLERLGCVVAADGAAWRVRVPSWRFDLAIEEDLVEEVARLHGYEHIGVSVPALAFVPPPSDPTHARLKLLLAGLGFQETLGYAFSSDAELSRAGAPEPKVRLLSPQGPERSALRTALYPGLLQAALTNRAQPALALFEVGRVFLDAEEERLALLLRGPWQRGLWRVDQPSDFYLAKGLLLKLARTVGAELALEPALYAHLHPGVSAAVSWNGETRGSLGRLHPEVAARYELGEVYVAELRLPLAGAELRFEDYARQPHAERDLAVVVPEEVPYARLAEQVTGAAGERLEQLWPFDVYAGDAVPGGHKSVALRLWFRHPERALVDGEVDTHMANVITALKARGYAIRER